MISYPMGAMKFYPASLRKMGLERSKYEHMFEEKNDSEAAGGSIELTIGNTINFYFPLEQRQQFYLTSYPIPEWKDDKKYTNLMKEGEAAKRKTL